MTCSLLYTVFFFLSDRMRDRGPCICGVGVWGLLLSLCLASLTHAHRSHTGRWMYVLWVCIVYIHSMSFCVQYLQCCIFRGLGLQAAFAANFFSRVVKLGVNRLCDTWGNAEAGFTMKCTTTEAGCQEHTKSSLKKKERRTQVIQQEGSSHFRSFHIFSVPSEGSTFQNACRLRTACSEPYGLEVPGCMIPVPCGPSGLVTNMIAPLGLLVFSGSFLMWRLGIFVSMVHNRQLCVKITDPSETHL